MRRTTGHVFVRLALIALTLAALVGCDIPRDPEGTLSRVSGGVLRAGITDHDPWTVADEPPSGIEAELLMDFAEGLGAEVEWRQGSEAELFKALERGDLDLIIGGILGSNPHKKKAALTQPYVKLGKDKHVWAVRRGENAFLLEIERFLQSREDQVLARLAEEES